MTTNKEELKNLPGVDKLLCHPDIKKLIEQFGRKLITYSIRITIEYFRQEIQNGEKSPVIQKVIDKVINTANNIGSPSLKPVINATGILIHTNLGRAPYGKQMLNDISKVVSGYNNLEFDINTGKRGQRTNHASELLKFLTGAEDVVIVNNNAAAVMFILRTFAKDKEVIVSRGELIEIGGSFRIPDIMAASDCKMVEVGTTNKTSITDFERAVTKDTALLFKAHKSNYVIKGFTQEADLTELVKLGKKKKIPVVYDIGSGLLRKIDNNILKNEPDVKQSLSNGIDLICFSGDKLLGGPQAGIIAGKKKYIAKLKKEPMMRALRVCKNTIAMIERACIYYLNDEDLFEKNFIFKTLSRKENELKITAQNIQAKLKAYKIETDIIKSKGQYGGGTLPDLDINSYSLKIIYSAKNKKPIDFSQQMFHSMLQHKNPVLSILKKGDIYIDVLTIFEDDIEMLCQTIADVYSNLISE